MMLKFLVFIPTLSCWAVAQPRPMSSQLHRRFFFLDGTDVDSTTPAVFGEVLERFGGGRTGPCHTLVYYDRTTMSDELLKKLQGSMGEAPMMLFDVTKIKFGLITARKKAASLPVIDLLVKRPEKDTCRVLLSWSRVHLQRSLLVLARYNPDIVRLKDTLILSTEDKNLGTFIPEIKRRIIVRKSESVSRLNITKTKFIVEQSCAVCDDLNFQTIANWDRDGGMTWRKFKESDGMSGALIKVSYTPSVPNIFNTSKGVLDGFEYRMLRFASEALNFTYVLQIPPDREWGRIVNGSWTGRVGDVVYKKADLAIGGMVYKPQRSDVAWYSTMFHYEVWSIMCPTPVKMPLWPYVLFPFRSNMAPSVFKALVFLHIIAFSIFSIASSLRRPNIEGGISFTKSTKNVLRVASSFYLRVMVCLYFWSLFYCILEAQYEEPINSSLGLLRSTKKYGLVRDTAVATVLAKSLDESQRELAKSALLFSSISEALYNVDEHGMCVVGVPKRYAESIIRSRYITRCGKPALRVSEENLHTVMGGWLMASKSPLKEKLDPIITKLQGFGFLDKWRSELYASLSRNRDERLPCIVQPVGPLSLEHLRLAFFLILAGWIIATALLLVERIAFNFIRNVDAEFGPTYNQSFIPVGHRNRRPRRTWAEKVFHETNPDREIRRDSLRSEGKLRYQIYSLLRDITEGNVVEERFQPLQSLEEVSDIAERNEGNKNALEVKRVSVVNNEHFGAELRRPASCNQVIMPQITIVQPYVTPLSRAVRVLPGYQRNENFLTYPELPNTPSAPPNSLAPRHVSLARFFSGRKRIKKETLWHIGDFGSDSQGGEKRS